MTTKTTIAIIVAAIVGRVEMLKVCNIETCPDVNSHDNLVFSQFCREATVTNGALEDLTSESASAETVKLNRVVFLSLHLVNNHTIPFEHTNVDKPNMIATSPFELLTIKI
ncbi:uncharacterized protein PHALS_12381 [Plasmopara halstedii]|uniref:RxLR-like protein n=1 Tax=Plasmopara halstedii TaxID=4781 RepID=A0A0N7L5P8_PLAHL|nr:uncharacterized protein PHALS_12381 [Plasmopara halstedii]CEG42075.1 hypothetical protein PHALS_12381 [Plasmopara halstedii]|eukprot:XP_024578444.1 hypothetical protein PHALS_12381 [Plasmopara halstedii]